MSQGLKQAQIGPSSVPQGLIGLIEIQHRFLITSYLHNRFNVINITSYNLAPLHQQQKQQTRTPVMDGVRPWIRLFPPEPEEYVLFTSSIKKSIQYL